MLSRSLNQSVMSIASTITYRVADRAPETFSDLVAASRIGTLPIFAGGSDKTIFGDASVNHAFRAWHDKTHIDHGLGFTLADELTVCDLQCAQLVNPHDRELLRADVGGQALYFARHGSFPKDQASFIAHYLTTGDVMKQF